MELWTITYFDSGEYKEDTLASFKNEEDAIKALKYAEQLEYYKELGYTDFDIRNDFIYDSFESFVYSMDCD